MRQGKDITVTAFSKMVGVSLAAAEQLAAEGIDVEVRGGDQQRGGGCWGARFG